MDIGQYLSKVTPRIRFDITNSTSRKWENGVKPKEYTLQRVGMMVYFVYGTAVKDRI